MVALALTGLLSCVSGDIYETGTPPPGGDNGGNGGGEARCGITDVQNMVLTRCGGCHGSMAPAAGLDLVSAGLRDRLLNQPSAACADRTLVIAGDPAQSYFLEKMAGLPECGVQMPKGGASMGASDLNCVSQWITDIMSSGAGGGGGGGGTEPPPPPPPGGW